MPLTDFCNVCLIPSYGEIREPRPAEFEDFYRTLSVGDERGVSSVTATSLQFPSVHYFALFITKVDALSAPDFAVLRHALYGDNTFSLGAIIARCLHLNRNNAKIHGVIYATRLESHFKFRYANMIMLWLESI